MPRLLTSRLTLAAACGIVLGVAGVTATALKAAEDLPLVVAQNVLPTDAAQTLQAALAQVLQVTISRATLAAPPTRGVYVLGNGVAPGAIPVTPAGLVATAPMVLVAHSAFPAVESAEILALLRKTAGAKIAHDGPGSASHRCFAQLRDQLPAAFTEVQKAPVVPPAQVVKAGEADLACLEAPLAIPLIQAGAVTPVLVAGDERLAAVWDVPTAAEVGLPMLSASAWFGLYLAGPDAKAEAAGKANAALQSVLADEKVQQSLTDAGMTPFPLTHRTAEAHTTFQAAETERGK